MALSTLLFGTPKKQIGTVAIDAFREENHTRTSEVTVYPVETGATITDHVVNNPRIISVSGVVTDVPNSIFGFIGGLIGESKVSSAFNALEKIIDSKIPVVLFTGLKTYTDLILIDFDVTRDVSTGDTLTFSATLQQINFVFTSLIVIPTIGSLQNLAKPVADVGTTVSGQTADFSIVNGAIDVSNTALEAGGIPF